MSKTHANSSIFSLPQEIIFNILSRLPTKSLIRFRCVCTSSAPLITHPSFTKLHLTTSTSTNNHHAIVYYENSTSIYPYHTNRLYSLRSPLTFHETLKLQSPSYPRNHGIKRFAGSNKGLICLFDSNLHSCSGTLLLWNPSINKHKILDGPHKVSNHFSLCVFGFGFVSRTCEFKVVGIVYDYKANENIETETNRRGSGCSCCAVYPAVDTNNTVSVYSLSTDSWEVKEGVSAPCYMNNGWFSATFVNGFVNWLAFKEDESRVIMAFDLDNERFQVLDLPKDIVPSYHNLLMNSFGEEGSLSLSLCAHYHVPVEKWDVWVMGEYGVVDSWKKVFVITHDFLSLPPLLMKNEREVLVVMNDGRLKLFDAIKNEMQDLQTRGTPAFFQAIGYTASLALLDG